MATLIAPDVESIEHLDPEILCSNDKHGEARPTASWWYNQHGCFEACYCDPCVERLRARCEQHLDSDGQRVLECGICQTGFTSVEDLFTVVPL
ncbi:hypothetical protein [Nocardia sp. NPDC004860]|uniref:hypothetical protein n=1 Tax=Nocardia sp. NPDC004860 TaxID=3154557 RepID=UPI0033B82095